MKDLSQGIYRGEETWEIRVTSLGLFCIYVPVTDVSFLLYWEENHLCTILSLASGRQLGGLKTILIWGWRDCSMANIPAVQTGSTEFEPHNPYMCDLSPPKVRWGACGPASLVYAAESRRDCHKKVEGLLYLLQSLIYLG